VNYGHSWCRHEPRVSRCHVFPLQGCKLVRIFVTPSKMGDGLIVVSKHRNSTFIMLYLYHEMDVDYFMDNEVFNINIDLSQLHV
jgi:hypothetical protein